MSQVLSLVVVGVRSRESYQVGFTISTKPMRLTMALGYSGAATNILTDLIFTVAPLVYISRVQLPKRTLWGVRAVFLLGLM